MGNDIIQSVGDMEKMAWAVANSGMFGIKTVEQALVLMAIAQAEGRPAALAARDYDVIQGRPAKKAEALLRDFLQAGGRVEWHQLDDTKADATFAHEQGGTVRIVWDIERAKQAGLAGKDTWKKYPRQMLRSRCVAEGARTVCPVASGGLPVTEELRDELPEKDVTPTAEALPEPAVTLGAVLAAYDAAQDVPAFQRAREQAARLPEQDKSEARAKDAATLKRLKGGDANAGVSAPSTATGQDATPAGSQQSEGRPVLSYAKLMDRMRERKDLDTLDADADLIGELPIDQQTEAAAEYHRLRGKLLPA